MNRAWVLFLLAGGCASERLPAQSTIRVFTAGNCAQLSWPVEAPVTSLFGARELRPGRTERHPGIDLAVPIGTAVRAACDGVVAYAGARLRDYGNLIILQHGQLATIYAHNSALLVREGQSVLRGGIIARSGATGRVTAPHLHFEVRADGTPRDPLEYLPHGQPDRTAQIAGARRPGLSQAGHPVQGRDAAARPRPQLPPLH
jgi:murein DD-endopeptidase MepM/ murein hydrolase activator NlpD